MLEKFGRWIRGNWCLFREVSGGVLAGVDGFRGDDAEVGGVARGGGVGVATRRIPGVVPGISLVKRIRQRCAKSRSDFCQTPAGTGMFVADERIGSGDGARVKPDVSFARFPPEMELCIGILLRERLFFGEYGQIVR